MMINKALKIMIVMLIFTNTLYAKSAEPVIRSIDLSNKEAKDALLNCMLADGERSTSKRGFTSCCMIVDGLQDCIECKKGKTNQCTRRMMVPIGWKGVFPGVPDRSPKLNKVIGSFDIEEALEGFEELKQIPFLGPMGSKEQAVCVLEISLEAENLWSDRFVISTNLQSKHPNLIWPIPKNKQKKSEKALLKATSSLQTHMGRLINPKLTVAQGSNKFKAMMVITIITQIQNAKQYLNASTDSEYDAIKAWIEHQTNNSNSLYSCLENNLSPEGQGFDSPENTTLEDPANENLLDSCQSELDACVSRAKKFCTQSDDKPLNSCFLSEEFRCVKINCS